MFWFIVLLLILGAGFYFYQKMMTIEREILAEQETQQGTAGTTEAVQTEETEQESNDPPVVTPEIEKMAAKAEPVVDELLSLEEEIFAAVQNMPGIKQTELYSSFADVDKKQLQKLLKELGDSGKLQRKKEGSSYQLFPNG